MGFWSGIKYALNSTIGTKEFVPLDKMFVYSKQLVPSDMELIPIPVDTEGFVIGATNNIPTKIRMINSGWVNVKAELARRNSSTSTTLSVYVDGSLSETLKSGTDVGSGVYVDVQGSVYFPKGAVISFSVDSKNIKNLRICASVIDSGLYEIEE